MAGIEACEETRYRVRRSLDPETARLLARDAQHDIDARWSLYESLAKRRKPGGRTEAGT